MPMIHLFDDGLCPELYPFHLVEGVGEIRLGAFTQTQRWERVEQEPIALGWTGELQVNGWWIPMQEPHGN